MKLAPIVPPGCAHLVQTEKVMAFADIAYADPKYAREYATRSGVILDNQIYENEAPLDPGQMEFIVSFIQPDLVIIPDARNRPPWYTIDMYDRYKHGLRRTGRPLAGVLQGRTHTEIMEMAKYWAQQDVEYVAIPMRVDGREFTRKQVWDRVQRTLEGKKIHFLGVEKWPYNDEAALANRVESCDTAEPTSATLWGSDMALSAFPITKRMPQFLSWPGYAQILEDRKELLWSNINWMSKMLAGSTSAHPVTQVESEDKETPVTELSL